MVDRAFNDVTAHPLQRRAACAFVYLTANGALQVIVLIHFSKWAIANTNHFIVWRAQCNCWRLPANHWCVHLSIFSFSFYSVESHYSCSLLSHLCFPNSSIVKWPPLGLFTARVCLCMCGNTWLIWPFLSGLWEAHPSLTAFFPPTLIWDANWDLDQRFLPSHLQCRQRFGFLSLSLIYLPQFTWGPLIPVCCSS